MNELSSLARNSMVRAISSGRGACEGGSSRRRSSPPWPGRHQWRRPRRCAETGCARRGNRVHPDAGGAAPRQCPHQLDLGVLGGGIAGHVRGRGKAHDAGGKDDGRPVRQVLNPCLRNRKAPNAPQGSDRRSPPGSRRSARSRPCPGVGDHHSRWPNRSRAARWPFTRGVGDIGHLPRWAPSSAAPA